MQCARRGSNTYQLYNPWFNRPGRGSNPQQRALCTNSLTNTSLKKLVSIRVCAWLSLNVERQKEYLFSYCTLTIMKAVNIVIVKIAIQNTIKSILVNGVISIYYHKSFVRLEDLLLVLPWHLRGIVTTQTQ